MSAAARLALQAWLSPAFPTGAFSYSHGLELAVAEGWIEGREGLTAWLAAVIERGSGRADCVLMGEAWRLRKAGLPLNEINALALALSAWRERHLETSQQGDAFRLAQETAWRAEHHPPWPEGPIAYPVAVAIAAADHAIPLEEAAPAYLNAIAASLASAAIRLGVIGQVDGQRLLVALQAMILTVAAEAAVAGPDGLGAGANGVDLASILHETQYSRLFRS